MRHFILSVGVRRRAVTPPEMQVAIAHFNVFKSSGCPRTTGLNSLDATIFPESMPKNAIPNIGA